MLDHQHFSASEMPGILGSTALMDTTDSQGQRSDLTQEVFVGAEFGGVQKELDEDVGGNNKNKANPQKS